MSSSNPDIIGGARNPYVLAELAEGKKIEWEAMTPLQIRQKLEQTLKMPYEKLFSPENDSPLYREKITLGRRS
jgi:hypothetical protein